MIVKDLIHKFYDPSEFTTAELLKIAFAVQDSIRQRIEDNDVLSDILEEH